MIVDSSALVAILTSEPERDLFLSHMADAAARRISAASLPETSIVLYRSLGPKGATLLDQFLSLADVESSRSHQPNPARRSRPIAGSAKERDIRPS
jgi:ribonuclease VapC